MAVASALLVVAAIMIVLVRVAPRAFPWSGPSKIYRACIALQRHTPETDAAYQACMRKNGLDPEDWT